MIQTNQIQLSKIFYDKTKYSTRPSIVCEWNKFVGTDITTNPVYEYFTPSFNKFVKPYFDYENKFDTKPNDIDSIHQDAVNKICEFFLSAFNTEINRNQIITASRHRDVERNGEKKFKVSFRFVILDYAVDWVAFGKMIKDYLPDFDHSCYNENQLMNMIGSIKNITDNDKHILQPIEDYDDKDTIIQYLKGNETVISIPEKYKTNKTYLVPTQTIIVSDSQTDTNKNLISFENLTKIIDNLNPKRSDEYNDWIKIIWCILNISTSNSYKKKGRDLIHTFSKNSTKYCEDEVENFIDKNDYKQHQVGLGTLMFYLKEDNYKVFNEIVLSTSNETLVHLEGFSFKDIEDMKSFKLNNTYNYKNLLNTDLVNGEYGKIKQVFEERNFKIRNPVAFVEIQNDQSIVLRNTKDFKTLYKNLNYKVVVKKTNEVEYKEFSSKWERDSAMKTYEKVDFYPNPSLCPEGVFNKWRGFAIERENITEPGDHTFFTDLLYYLVNKRDDVYNYVLASFANIIQNPDKPSQVALAFYSEMNGVGKNAILNTFRHIVGFDDLTYETCDPEKDIFGRFANGRAFKLMVVVDETQAKSHFNYADFFKNYITSLSMNVEEKGIKPMTIKNYNNWFFTTNNLMAFKVGLKDRRYCIIDCVEIPQSQDYYIDYLNKERYKPNLKALYDFLKSYDISKVNFQADRPITTLYKDLQMISLDPITKWVIHLYYWIVNDNTDGSLEYKLSDLWEQFVKWGETTKHTINMNYNSFAVIFSRKFKNNGFTYRHSNGAYYLVKSNELRKYLIEQKLIEADLPKGFKIRDL